MRENGGLAAAFIFGLVLVSAYFGFAAANLGGPQPKRDHGGQQEQKTGAPELSIVQPPTGGGGKQAGGCPGTRHPQLSCEALTAEATMRQADLAAEQSDIGWFNIALGALTAVVAGMAAMFARNAATAAAKSYKAFVAAEDANLFVEFIDGSLVESSSEGRRQPDTYFFNVRFTNVGRSTARLHFFTKGQQSIAIDHTLKTGDSVEVREPLEVGSLEKFRIMIWYASPIRPSACQIVTAVPFLQKNAPGGVAATVYSSELFNLDEKRPE